MDSLLPCLLVLCLSPLVVCQVEIKWVDTLEGYQLFENTPVDSYIRTVRAVYEGTDDSSDITYGFNDNPDLQDDEVKTTSGYFEINTATGDVTLRSPVDFDGELNADATGVERTTPPFTVGIIAKGRDDTFKKFFQIIPVININDEDPVLKNNSLQATVSENATIPEDGYLLLSNIRFEDVDGSFTGVSGLQFVLEYCVQRGTLNYTCAQQFFLRQSGTRNNYYINMNLFLNSQLDFEILQDFQLKIQVSDGANVINTDVKITVNDAQDQPPIWINFTISTVVQENLERGEVETFVEALDQDSIAIRRNISYTIVDGFDVAGIDPKDVFEIDSRSGRITNKVKLDLENSTYFRYQTPAGFFLRRTTWPLHLRGCELLSEDPDVPSTNLEVDCTVMLNISITILDVNDNGPLLSQNNYTYRIKENVLNGILLDKPDIIIVTDDDTDAFDDFNTILLTPSEEFALIGGNSTPAIVIKNTSLIDYDSGVTNYSLVIRAFDPTAPILSSTANVFIIVEDVNDIIPKFGQDKYFATVSELAPEGENITQVEAFDIDTELRGKRGIEYDLVGSGATLFRINSLDGRITVAPCLAGTPGIAPCLDYDEGPQSYEIRVLAVDEVGDGNTGSATLTIQLLDENDNRPVISPNEYFLQIFEGTREFTPNKRFFVEGTDGDATSDPQFRISSELPPGFWKIDSTTGEITLDKPNNEAIRFNDSTNGEFILEVELSDGILPHASATVNITVLDINDNAPFFFPDYYEKSIPEDTPEGTYLLTVTARDNDDPTTNNGRIQYNIISDGADGRFVLNETTGDLFVAEGATFNFVRPGLNYTLRVRANDLGTPTLEDFATVLIIITNVNDKSPIITPVLQNGTLLESEQPGIRVLSVSAQDPDDNAVLVFRFTDRKQALNSLGNPTNITTYDFRDTFRIENTTGNIFLNGFLNYSLASLFTYEVEVEDINATTKQTGRGTVFITVIKVNAGPPTVFNAPANITVDEELQPYTTILTLFATDEDGIDRFALIEQPNNFFTINPLTGSVQILGRVDYDGVRLVNSSYFVVTVTDRGSPSLTSTVSVNVFFRNINDNIPQFYRSPTQPEPGVNLYTTTIRENSEDGTNVTQVFATDFDRPDESGFHIIEYTMTDDRFDIHPTTGRVFVRLKPGFFLDRERSPRVLAEVRATDNPNRTNGQPRRQKVATIQVRLGDANDNPSRFSKDNFVVRIFETTQVGRDILQLFYTDPDLGNNAISYFTKVFKNETTDVDDLFSVDRILGQVIVQKSLLGKVGTYLFFVEAQDNLGTGFITTTSVTVIVSQSANTPPIWVRPPMDNMTIFVLEEQYYGLLVYDVFARDLDSGDNGKVDYSLISEGQTKNSTAEFTINKITGVIHADIIFDRERVNRYVLLLKASDRADNSLEATRFLTVVIKDVNDNVPTFPLNEVEFTVNEDADVGYSVGQVSARDIDLDPIIKYQIISGNEEGVFRVDEDTGEIFTLQPLDTEDKSIYYIDILATNDEPVYSVIRNRRKRAVDPSIVTVKIVIGDINDLAPQFLEDRYYGCISTRSPLGKYVVTISAVDRDAIGTGIVRYSLNKTMEGGADVGNNFFAIHPKFGIVSNSVLMGAYVDQTFDLTVNARDGLDPADSESSNTNVKIFVTQPGKEVKLLITQNTAEVRLYQSQIQSIIEQSENLDYLCIIDIQDHRIDSVGSTSTLWSDVYVAGIREESDGRMNILGSRALTNIINLERNNRGNDFDLLYIREVEPASSSDELELDDKAVIIILIIIAVLIFLVIIFCIVAFMCIKAAKTTKKHRLVHKTNSPPPPAPVIMAEPAPEPVIYDNRGFIQEVDVPVVQEQEIIHTEPIHVEYAVVKKRSPSPVNYEPEYRLSDPVDDGDVIVVPLDDGPPQQMDVYETEPEDEYRIVTEVVPE